MISRSLDIARRGSTEACQSNVRHTPLLGRASLRYRSRNKLAPIVTSLRNKRRKKKKRPRLHTLVRR